MTIKQLSVFLENKTGRINDVTKTLAKYDINMHAFSMAESTDFGILRLIVSDVEKAVEVLRAENFAMWYVSVARMWQVLWLKFWTIWQQRISLLNICMLLLREIRHMWLSVRLMWRDVWRY